MQAEEYVHSKEKAIELKKTFAPNGQLINNHKSFFEKGKQEDKEKLRKKILSYHNCNTLKKLLSEENKKTERTIKDPKKVQKGSEGKRIRKKNSTKNELS